MNEDSFAQNIAGVKDLIQSETNKVKNDTGTEEGVEQSVDVLELSMTDSELLRLKDIWKGRYDQYYPSIKTKQENNKKYYLGRQHTTGDSDIGVSSNYIFEAEETFIPQALSKNPEPVVWSDNTAEGKEASNDIKTMLQYHADVLCLRKKLGVMVRHWSVYYLGVLKHGWDAKNKDIKLDIRKPKNFILDPEGYVDEYGNFVGLFLGEVFEYTAEKLIEQFPKHKDYVTIKVDGKMGTKCAVTEWWTDEYCFTTFQDVVLDKHKNEFFNYGQKDAIGEEVPGQNHFATPKMPYTFLSVFSFQEQPHDVTNLIEQNVPNQDRINDRDEQISRNLKSGNNSIALSGLAFNSETARQAASALEDGSPVLVPNGQVEQAIKRLPASGIPTAVFQAQENDKTALRSIFGTQGLSAQQMNEDTTARGMILNQNHDTSRIGGGIGDALEQVADNVFNWWLQLYFVFYDEPHYGAVMGSGKAVEYVQLINSNINRKFVVSVSPNSMQPKDEVTEMNLAIDMANKGWLDPINLFKKLNYADPMETAKMVTLFKINPQLYMQQFFPENAPMQVQQPQGNPGDMQTEVQGEQPQTLAEPPASAALNQVPLTTEAMPQKII